MSKKLAAVDAMRKRLFLLYMLFAVILGGCGAPAENLEEKAGGEGETLTVVERVGLDSDLGAMEHMQLVGDTCYYVRYETGADPGQVRVLFCRQQGEGPEEILHTCVETGADYYLMCSRVDTLGNRYNLYSRSGGEEAGVFLEKLDIQGSRQYCIGAELFADELRQITDGAVGPQGEFYALRADGTVFLWDGRGKELRRLTADLEESGLARTAGFVNAGEAGVYLYDNTGGGITFRKVDGGQKSLEKPVEVKLSAASGEARPAGSSEFSAYKSMILPYSVYRDFCYLSDENGLWRYSFGEGKAQALLGWSDPFVSLERRHILQISENGGALTLLCYDAQLKSSSRLKLDWRKLDELTGKTVVTLGCGEFAAENLDDVVKRYNARSTQYLVELKTYQFTGSGEKLDEMTVDLLQGKGPDLFELTFAVDVSMKYYASKGILENLDPYLADSGVKLVEPVLDALRVDGNLYTIGDSFFLQGLVCPREYVRDGGISIEQCMNMKRDYPEACFMKKSNMMVLERLLDADMESYVNLRERICRFDSGDFIGLLDTVKDWKESADSDKQGIASASPDELSRKQYLVEEVSAMSMVDYLATRRAIEGFGVFAGYPNTGGEAMYHVRFSKLYGMNSASRVKDGAWDFLAYLISEDNQKRVEYFPMAEEDFRAALEKGQGENEAHFSLFTGERETGLVPAPEDIEDVWEIVRHVYYPDQQQSVISKIVQEETWAVLDGKKTAKDAAEKIQNRVSLFLAE